MKIVIISDIHSNYDALLELEKRLKNMEFDEIWCLGDVVGYNAEPNECVDWVRKNSKYILMGNHDYAVLQSEEKFLFNEYARRAIEWTEKKLFPENKIFLKTFKISLKIDEIFLVHSSPSSPLKWEYVTGVEEAIYNFNFLEEKICFLGHTHIPLIFELKEGKLKVIYPECKDQKFLYILDRDAKYIINSGSVGQPRDGDPRLSLCIFDKKNYAVEFFRFEYDVEKAARKVFETDLPHFLGERLFIGR
ncbi:MAG: metallophosphoesterase family protein [candidate division WOR-3 bacterium]